MDEMVGHVEAEHGVRLAEVARLREEAAVLRKQLLRLRVVDGLAGPGDEHVTFPSAHTHG